MDKIAGLINEWGPWFLTICGSMSVCLVLFDWLVMKSFEGRQSRLLDQMSPASREFVTRELGDRPRHPGPSKAFPIVCGTVQIVAGLAWLALR
jgi:hypothetical protein